MDAAEVTVATADQQASTAVPHNPPPLLEDEELQKAKLFTVASEDGAWTEIGIGSVHIRVGSDDGSAADDEASDDAAGGTVAARLDVISLEEDNEVLMSTPLVEDDIYVVQHGSILVWSDPEIGRDMALSFNTAEGCKHITDAIMTFQAERRDRAKQAAGATSSAVGHLDKTPNVAARQTSSGVSSDGGTDEQQSPWSVCRANLPTIALALHNNTKRLGMYIRDHDGFGAQLTQLFNACHAQQDLVGKDHIGRIVVALLGPPFNTEGRILSQLIDNDVIDTTIAIVQHALGRRTPETGFVDAATRRATFSNPCHLPHAVVAKIHVLFAVQYLKDMLPLLLDEGDAAGSSLLGVFLLRFKFGLVGEIARSATTLTTPFQSHSTHATLDTMRAFVAFLHDLTKTIKNAMIPFDPKEELFEELLNRGTLEYVRRALWGLMAAYPILWTASTDAGHRAASAASYCTPEASDELNKALQIASMLCDVVAHMIMFLPRARDELLYDASSAAAATRRGGEVDNGGGVVTRQHANDDGEGQPSAAMHGIVQGLRYPSHPSTARRSDGEVASDSAQGQEAPAQQCLQSSTHSSAIWQGMLSADAPPLLRVMCHTAVYACLGNHPAAAQSAYDMVYSAAIGLLQGNVYASLGHNIQPQRLQVLRYWASPPPPPASVARTSQGNKSDDVSSSSSSSSLPALGGSGNGLAVQKTLEVLDAATCAAAAEGNNMGVTNADTLDAWPPLYVVLHAAGNVPVPPSTVDSGSWLRYYRCLHHLYRQLIPLCKEAVVYQHQSFARMLLASCSLAKATSLLNATVWTAGGVHTQPSDANRSAPSLSNNVAPHGALGNVQATVLSWLSVLVSPGEAAVLEAVDASGIMDPVVRIYMARFGRRPGGGGCVLGSNAANVLHALRNALHNKKGIAVGSPAPSTAAAGNPHAFPPLPLRGQQSFGSSPFIRSIGKDDALGGASRDASTTTGATRPPPPAVDTATITHLLDKHGAALSASHVPAHRQLAAAFAKVVQETPEEAQDEVSSSRATSTVVDRVVISDQDFNALLAEYGPDAPISETMLLRAVGDDVTGSHAQHGSAALAHAAPHPSASRSSSDRDDEDGSSEAADDEEEAEEARVGFLLRRETTLRRKRPLSPTADAADALSSGNDDEDEDHEATTSPPIKPTKTARHEGDAPTPVDVGGAPAGS